jgi:hypothetical protein
VVDPGKTKDSCDLPTFFQGKVIIVASPDEQHWGGSSFDKEVAGRGGRLMYFPVWELHELLKSLSVFNQITKINKTDFTSLVVYQDPYLLQIMMLVTINLKTLSTNCHLRTTDQLSKISSNQQ